MTTHTIRTDRFRSRSPGGRRTRGFGRRFRRTGAVPSIVFLVLLLLIAAMVVLLPSRTAAADDVDATESAATFDSREGARDAWSATYDSDRLENLHAAPEPGLWETSEAFRYTDFGLLRSRWAVESGAFSG